MKAANCVNIKNTATNIEKKVNIILDVLSPILQIHNKKRGAKNIPINPKLDINSSKIQVVKVQPIGSLSKLKTSVTK